MKIKQFTFNMLQVNTYVLISSENDAIVIDSACFYENEKQQLRRYLNDNNLNLKFVLNTHLHFDHVLGNKFLLDEYGVVPMAHLADEFLNDETYAMMMGVPLSEPLAKIFDYIGDGQIINWSGSEIKVMHVPGHSPGGVVFYCEREKCLFSGDVLFNQSIGRSDLPGGNHEQLIEGIKSKIFSLPDDVIVYPGHGPATSIGDERRLNPFFRIG